MKCLAKCLEGNCDRIEFCSKTVMVMSVDPKKCRNLCIPPLSINIYRISYILQIFCTCNSRFRTSISPFTSFYNKKSHKGIQHLKDLTISLLVWRSTLTTMMVAFAFWSFCFCLRKPICANSPWNSVENPNLNTSTGVYGPWMTMNNHDTLWISMIPSKQNTQVEYIEKTGELHDWCKFHV